MWYGTVWSYNNDGGHDERGALATATALFGLVWFVMGGGVRCIHFWDDRFCFSLSWDVSFLPSPPSLLERIITPPVGLACGSTVVVIVDCT